jgi:hypothetical protein
MIKKDEVSFDEGQAGMLDLLLLREPGFLLQLRQVPSPSTGSGQGLPRGFDKV